jgi:xanthine dehydrogenase accessory factor
MESLYECVAEAVARGESVALATLVRVEGSTPRELGSKMVVYADGCIEGTIGGGAMEGAAIAAAREAIAQGRSRLLHYELREPTEGDLGICGGAADVFIDVAVPRPTLLIVGAGHVAMPVAEIGHLCGYRVVVLDDRADMVARERFPHAAECKAGEIVELLRASSLTPSTYVVIVTRGHSQDEAALRAVLDSQAAYVGMIGSRRKVRTTFERLVASGAPEALLHRVHAPIGLDIGAQTPAEIAVSILAEITLLRKGVRGAHLDGSTRSMRLDL